MKSFRKPLMDCNIFFLFSGYTKMSDHPHSPNLQLPTPSHPHLPKIYLHPPPPDHIHPKYTSINPPPSHDKCLPTLHTPKIYLQPAPPHMRNVQPPQSTQNIPPPTLTYPKKCPTTPIYLKYTSTNCPRIKWISSPEIRRDKMIKEEFVKQN